MEKPAQFLQGTTHPFLRSVFAAAQDFADRPQIALFKEAQQNGSAVIRAQLVDGFVEDGSNLGQIRLREILLFIHGNRLPFADLAATLAAHDFGGHEARVAVQPAAQHHVAWQCAGLARQVHENSLGHVLRQMRVPTDQPDRC